MYQPDHWHEAFVVLGTGSAAIAGLIIVAASVRAEVMNTLHWRSRAQNSTLGMILITIVSILVLVPQPVFWLGIELIVINLINACVLPGSVVFHELRHRTGLPIRASLMAASFFLVAAAGGASLIVARGGGLYLVLAAYLGLLLTAVINAYALLVPHRDSPES